MNISIIGAGYVGLVTGVCLAEMGQMVTFVDRSKYRIQQLIRAEIPFQEPCLEALLRKNLILQHLNFSSNYSDTLKNADIIFITDDVVSTNETENQVMLKAARMIKYLKKECIVIFKTPIKATTKTKLKKIIERRSNAIKIVYNPTLLREGFAIEDFFNKEKIIIDADCEITKKKVFNLYQPLLSV